MQISHFTMLSITTFFLLIFPNVFCLADTNIQTSSLCGDPDNSFNEFQNNLRTSLTSLNSNLVHHKGFYQTIVGKKDNRIYVTILCRGDISANNCSNCILNSTKAASNHCPKSKDVIIWSTWCFLRYSNQSYFGDMQQTAALISNKTDIDDKSLVSKGFPFMSGLAASATEQPLMFQTAVLKINQSETRYGMAQCTRDISRKDCGKCLDAQLANFRFEIENKRRWEILGSNCFMWYNDYQFYSNVSTLLSAAWKPSSNGRFISGIAIAVSAAFLVVF